MITILKIKRNHVYKLTVWLRQQQQIIRLFWRSIRQKLKIFIKNDKLDDDIDTKNDDLNDNNTISCSYCDKIFTKIDSLKKHLNSRCKT